MKKLFKIYDPRTVLAAYFYTENGIQKANLAFNDGTTASIRWTAKMEAEKFNCGFNEFTAIIDTRR